MLSRIYNLSNQLIAMVPHKHGGCSLCSRLDSYVANIGANAHEAFSFFLLDNIGQGSACSLQLNLQAIAVKSLSVNVSRLSI